MPDPVRIYFVGTAGSGKSTLTKAFKLWMDERGLSTITVNLDPGVEETGYTPDVDIRDWVSVSDVMENQGLGPNGAQIACADMAALQFPEISKIIEEYRSDYILIDTPGQIELFAFREASRIFLDVFTTPNAIIVFVLDPAVAKTPAGLVSLLILSTSIQSRFQAPTELVLGKSDLLEEEELETIIDRCQYPDRLINDLEMAGMEMQEITATEFMRAMEALDMHRKPIPVSGLEIDGIEDLYNTIQQIFSGGEDLRPD